MSSSRKQQRRSMGWLQKHARLIWLLQRMVDSAIAIMSLWSLSFIYGIEFSEPYIILAAIAALIMWPIFKGTGIYYSYRSEHPAATYPQLCLAWAIIFVLLLLIGYVTQTSALFSRLLLCSWFVLTPLALCIHHLAVRILLRQIRTTGLNSRKAVIAGTGELSQHLAQQLRDSPQLGLQFCGFFVDKPLVAMEEIPVRPLIGTLEELPDYVRRHRIDVVYIAMAIQNEATVSPLMNALRDTTACVYFVPNLTAFSLMQARVQNFQGIPLIAVWEMPVIHAQIIAKRATDIAVALIALLLSSPLMIAIAIALKASSSGPILIKQQRYDCQGKAIAVYRFCTDECPPEVARHSIPPHLAPQYLKRAWIDAFLQKTGLESCPKFINVLQGHLSIVGPRPQLAIHTELYRQYTKKYSRIGLEAKPGLTGWAQIHGLPEECETPETLQQQIAYDLDYLQNWSFWLDLRIMAKTTFNLSKRPLVID
jgi:putative colanic acid biosysnthesis UDP-glucose lipid carrier transferase